MIKAMNALSVEAANSSGIASAPNRYCGVSCSWIAFAPAFGPGDGVATEAAITCAASRMLPRMNRWLR